MADSKQDESFKVIDRRHFTESGELRQDVVEQEKREEEAAKKHAAANPKPARDAQPAATAPGESASGIVAPAGANAGGTATSGEEGVADAEAIPPSRSFQMLVDFLTRNAAAMLGGMADPRTGQAFVDLEGAREVIDMLDALREKTKGNLSKEDDQLLIEVLGSLKLSFMEISKAAADQMAKKVKGK
ncbi:MAG: DUF1844 domain-containing protein [Candidatus Acidiferrales bacterium]